MTSPISKNSYDLADEKLIRKIVRSLPPSSGLRMWAGRALAGEAIPTDVIPTLCTVLRGGGGEPWPNRLIAGRCLASANWRNSNRDDVCTALREAAAGRFEFFAPPSPRRPLSREDKWILAIFLFVGIPLLVIGKDMIPEQFYERWVDAAVGVSIAGIILYGIGTVIMRSNISSESRTITRRRAIQMLAELGDCRAIGEVAHALHDTDSEVSKAARSALPVLLDAVRAKHYGMLPKEATPALCELIYGSDRLLAMQAINALARAGDGRAVEPVMRQKESAIQTLHWLRAEHGRDAEVAVLEAAERALPILEERLRNETAAERLLRPAESPANPAEVLLRPAGSATSVPDTQLLRPAEADATVKTDQAQ